MQESESYPIQHVTVAVSNLFQKQHSKKQKKPTKRLNSTIGSTVKAALLIIY